MSKVDYQNKVLPFL